MGKKRKRFMKHIMMMVLMFCMVMGVVSVVPMKVEAVDWTCGAYTTENPFAKKGYYGQCTWYAWGRAYEVTGKMIRTVDNHSSAKYWIENNTGHLPIGKEPCANSIAVWSGGDYGHVAYVESVNGDMVTISEANYRKNYLDSQSWTLDVGMLLTS